MEDLLTKEKTRVDVPRNYNVVMINDDFTPMDFVVDILVGVFGKTLNEALALTLEVHNKGRGIAGTYTRDIAETKVTKAMDMAKAEEHPFRVEVQPA
ncbi:ATP-dependent Clp protease adaptor ClpS [uncultured Salinicola sp.]|uniref:ATP-dependent Clp protease adaptor ClpS n=1 Tax=uncultured Salinicola sp. TaxID=1193542 RepID=UPI002632252E|nr:ATP-dependent Clp protease adaptor ClpS [uncultured Salinicola sp.]|tara:strand:+ start:1408 stop:1698 length:291 start_codon:yes stop_codon:yes gene_type:complete